MLAMNNQINAARYVTKTHTANVETFRSGEYGFLGEVYPDRVNFASAPARRQHLPIQAQTMPEVEIFPMYGGANGQAVRQAVDRGVKGIVIDALGMRRTIQFGGVLVVVGTGLVLDKLIPGVGETLRVNGQARLRDEGHYTALFAGPHFHPKLVIEVQVQEAYLHCSKAVMRSKLWQADAPRIIQGLVARQQAGRWYSTTANA